MLPLNRRARVENAARARRPCAGGEVRREGRNGCPGKVISQRRLTFPGRSGPFTETVGPLRAGWRRETPVFLEMRSGFPVRPHRSEAIRVRFPGYVSTDFLYASCAIHHECPHGMAVALLSRDSFRASERVTAKRDVKSGDWPGGYMLGGRESVAGPLSPVPRPASIRREVSGLPLWAHPSERQTER